MSLPLHQSTYKFFVEGLIKQINCESVLEIGLGKEAHTAKVCLDFFTSKNSGKYSVLDFNPLPEALSVLKQYDPKYWSIKIGDTSKDNVLFQDFHDNRADLILVDGSHWITHVINDIQQLVVNGCAKSDSIFIFHDTNGSHVRHAIYHACKEFNIQCFEIEKANLVIGRFKSL